MHGQRRCWQLSGFSEGNVDGDDVTFEADDLIYVSRLGTVDS